MLVLTRGAGKGVFIGIKGGIKITVLEINGGRVELGFEADTDIPIRREEIQERLTSKTTNVAEV